jgi:hypothetical protein
LHNFSNLLIDNRNYCLYLMICEINSKLFLSKRSYDE